MSNQASSSSSEPPPDGDADAAARSCADVLCVVQLLGSMSFAVTMQAQTGLIYRLARGDTQLAVRVISNTSSASSLLAFLVGPAMGKLSDIYGRRPFITLFPLLVTLLRTATALRPSWETLILGRLLTETTSPVFFASIQAAVADTHLQLGGSMNAVSMARIQTWMGVAMTLGPLLGGQLASLDLRLPFAASAAFGAANVLWLQTSFQETRVALSDSADEAEEEEKGKEDDQMNMVPAGSNIIKRRKPTGVNPATLAAAARREEEKGKGKGKGKGSSAKGKTWLANPLSFLRLFSGPADLATLATVSGLQVLSGEGALRDVERLYTRNQLGWDAAQDGWFLSAQGCVSIIGGRLSQLLLGGGKGAARGGNEGYLGQREFTTFANSSSILQLLLKGFAASAAVAVVAGVGPGAGAGARKASTAAGTGAGIGIRTGTGYLMWLALLPAILGNLTAKNAAVRSMETQQAIASGMDKGEHAAAHSNVNALMKFLAPQLYGYVYRYAVSGGGAGKGAGTGTGAAAVPLQGLPYFVAAAVMVLAEALMWRVRRTEVVEEHGGGAMTKGTTQGGMTAAKAKAGGEAGGGAGGGGGSRRPR